MNKFASALLGSSCLTALSVTPVLASAIVESDVGPFGASFGAATVLTPDVTEIFGDVFSEGGSEGASTAFFRYVGYDSSQSFSLRLTTSQIATEGDSEGGAFIVIGGLTPAVAGVPTYLADSEGLSLSLLSSEGGSEGASLVPSSLAPVLTFYDDAGAVLDQLRLDYGNSFEVAGLGLTGSTLNFSVEFDYQFIVEADVPALEAVPEPNAALLMAAGLTGLAGSAALRRRRRKGPASS